MQWSPDLDRTLTAIAAANPKATDAQIALMFTESTGIQSSADMVRNRQRRIAEAAETQQLAHYSPESDEGFIAPVPREEYVGFRIAFWDTESTSLIAMMGRMLSASVGDSWGNVVSRTIYDFPQESMIDDSGLCEWLRDELERYDIIVSHNGFNHDHPLLNARLLRWGKRPMADRLAVDPMWKARGGRYGAKVGSSKLVNLQKFFNVADAKSEISWETWQLAAAGDKDALTEVVDHCERDVLVLRSVFNHLKPLIRTLHR